MGRCKEGGLGRRGEAAGACGGGKGLARMQSRKHHRSSRAQRLPTKTAKAPLHRLCCGNGKAAMQPAKAQVQHMMLHR